jgi:hypothetical protein
VNRIANAVIKEGPADALTTPVRLYQVNDKDMMPGLIAIDFNRGD